MEIIQSIITHIYPWLPLVILALSVPLAWIIRCHQPKTEKLRVWFYPAAWTLIIILLLGKNYVPVEDRGEDMLEVIWLLWFLPLFAFPLLFSALMYTLGKILVFHKNHPSKLTKYLIFSLFIPLMLLLVRCCISYGGMRIPLSIEVLVVICFLASIYSPTVIAMFITKEVKSRADDSLFCDT